MKYKWLSFLIIPISAFADELIVSNVSNGCSNSLQSHTYLRATFTRSQYQCSTGYYVPANTDHCVVCPDVYDCDGGTFTFNDEYNQGNKFKVQVTENIRNGCKTNFLRAFNNVANITATFTPNVHNCSAGYYLPANIDECRQCPANSYCGGGTYTFNETTNQGITQCPSTHPISAAGASSINQCKKQINWYSTDNNLTTSTMCNYNGLINLPPAPAPRTGYVFNGWKLQNSSD